MPQTGSVKRHPLSSVILLLALILAGYIIFTMITLALALFTGTDASSLAAGDMDTGFLRLMQGLTSVGAFILPPLFLALAERKYKLDYFGEYKKHVPVKLIILTVAIMYIAAPFTEWTIRVNQMLHLPDFLKGVEEWMRQKEDMLGRLTKQLLTMHSVPDLLVNLLVIALIPAIGEELLFRGCFQNIFTRITRNYHWGIFITAVLFSAIHFQFFGFFPRMLLGVLFGYLFAWSRSIWLAVLAHFLNNGTAVLGAYLLQKKGKPLDDLDSFTGSSAGTIVFSMIFTFLLLWVFYINSVKKQSIRQENEL